MEEVQRARYGRLRRRSTHLCDKPLFFLVNSYTTGLQPAVLNYMISTEVKSKFGGTVMADEIGLPCTVSGLPLPCGAAGRWQR